MSRSVTLPVMRKTALFLVIALTPAEIREHLVETATDPQDVFVLSAGLIDAAAAVPAAASP